MTAVTERPLVGMVHLPPLPGAPNARATSVKEMIGSAVEDARRLADGGLDAILIQNANDHPPRAGVPGATVAAYAVIAAAISDAVEVPIGINVLKRDVEATLGIAHAVGAAFVRLKAYVGVEVGAEGMLEGCAADAVELRRTLGSRVEIWADAIQPTSRPLGDPSVPQLVEWCATFGEADRVIITGRDLDETLSLIRLSRDATRVPLICGGGVDDASARRALGVADGLIVGRWLRGATLSDPVDPERVRRFVSSARD